MNTIIKQDELDEIKHYGKLGMKWGKTLHGYTTRSLGKQTTKVVRRFDKGQADADKIINRFNKNPEKRAMVEDYMKTMQAHGKTLEEYRMDLIDVRL